MKKFKFILPTFIIFILCIVLYQGDGNWTYTVRDNYKIKRTSVNDIYFYDNDEILLDKYVSSFAIYNDGIILETLRQYDESIIVLYYVFLYNEETFVGPFTKAELNNYCSDNNIDNNMEFIETSSIKK